MWGLLPSEFGLCFIRPDDSLFTYYQYHFKLKKVLSEQGYDAQRFSSHSIRRGGCMFTFLCSVLTDLICNLGSWKTDT